MTGLTIHHLNAGILHAPPSPAACCHCLLLEHACGLALVDTGIGLQDIAFPEERIGRAAIQAAGFQFDEHRTAARQIERLGHHTDEVTDIILTHADPDHAGGLADFPQAIVHVAAEELACLQRGGARYSPAQFSHQPRWRDYAPSSTRWFRLEARPVRLSFEADVRLIPLPGHTLGHCGVAVHDGGRWLLHVGDAWYLRAELETDDHPVSILAAQRADDDRLRRDSLASLRRLSREHGQSIRMFGTHDFGELPPARDV